MDHEFKGPGDSLRLRDSRTRQDEDVGVLCCAPAPGLDLSLMGPGSGELVLEGILGCLGLTTRIRLEPLT